MKATGRVVAAFWNGRWYEATVDVYGVARIAAGSKPVEVWGEAEERRDV